MKVAATKLQISTTTKNYKVCAPHNKKKEAKKTVRFVTIVAVMTAFYILILVLVLVPIGAVVRCCTVRYCTVLYATLPEKKSAGSVCASFLLIN